MVRELMIAAPGGERVLALYANDPGQAPDEALLPDRHIVVKFHRARTSIFGWQRSGRALPSVCATRAMRYRSIVGSFMMDRVTQIFRGHIGDTRSGKWHGLPTPLRDELTRVFGPFLDRFGYLDQESDGGR